MKRTYSILTLAAFAVGMLAGSLSLVPMWAQTVPVTNVNLSQLGGATVPMITTHASNIAYTQDAFWVGAVLYCDSGTDIDLCPQSTGGAGTADANTTRTIESSDTLLLEAADFAAAFGTAGASDSQVLSVQGIASGTALPVSLASVPSHAVTNAGTFAVQVDGNALTALQLIDNIVGVEDVAETAGGGLAMAGAVVRSTAAGSSATAGDNATVNVDTLGRLWARDGNPCMDHARITTAAISNSTSGNVEVVGLNGSDLIYVCGYSLVAGAATGVRFVYGTGTACATGEAGITGIWSFAANGGITQANAGAPQFVVPAGNAFCTENSGANSIQGHVTYVRTASP